MAKPHSDRITALRHRLEDIKAKYGLAAELAALENETIEEIRRDLEEARQETIERLARLTGTLDIAQATQILAELQRQQNELFLVWKDLFYDILEEAWEEGTEAAIAPAKGTAVEVTIKPFISTRFLEVAEATLPDLIKGIQSEYIADIGRLLRRGVLAQETPLQIIRDLGKMGPFQVLDPKTMKYRPMTDAELRASIEAKGPFNKMFRRLEAIMRSEIGRISQTANWLTGLELARQDPRYRKEWTAVLDGRTRPDHARADGQRQQVDKPFIVGGYQLQFPHDPKAPASETVNCRCILVMWHPVFDEQGATPNAADADHGHPATPKLPAA